MPLLLVRHASAGDREGWDGDDRDRPLDERGHGQARELVELLAPFEIDAILTSPYKRCVDTVIPLGRARGVPVEEWEELSEELQLTEGLALVESLRNRNAVVCGHGGLDSVVAGAPKWKKGTVFVLGSQLELLDAFRV